ncbi:MAG: phage head closure protein [Paraclostridium sp.]
MDPGQLNKIIKIEKRTVNQSSGFEVEDWNYFKSAWASIKNINGNEYFLAQQARSKATKKVRIRYIKELDQSLNQDVSLEYRVLYEGSRYNILYSDNIKEQKRFLELLLES